MGRLSVTVDELAHELDVLDAEARDAYLTYVGTPDFEPQTREQKFVLMAEGLLRIFNIEQPL